MIVFGTVLFFSLIQSLFGMGLLIFGTPTLLLLGLEFTEILATLLPASITISCLQFVEDRAIEPRFARQFALWCLPSLGVGLAALLRYAPDVALELPLGCMMLVFAALRLLPRLSIRARDLVRRHSPAFMVLMGTVHGLSNLGGGVLSVVAGAHFSDKDEVRRTIAFCYLCFATIQISVLVAFRPEIFDWTHLLTMALAGIVYMTLGRRTFALMPQVVYERMFLVFMMAYALVLFGRGFGLI